MSSGCREMTSPVPIHFNSRRAIQIIKLTKVRGNKKCEHSRNHQNSITSLYDVRGPVVDEAARMEESGTQILKLNIGNPAPFGFRTPDEVIYDMRQQLTECEGYSHAQGLFSQPEKRSCNTHN